MKICALLSYYSPFRHPFFPTRPLDLLITVQNKCYQIVFEKLKLFVRCP